MGVLGFSSGLAFSDVVVAAATCCLEKHCYGRKATIFRHWNHCFSILRFVLESAAVSAWQETSVRQQADLNHYIHYDSWPWSWWTKFVSRFIISALLSSLLSCECYAVGWQRCTAAGHLQLGLLMHLGSNCDVSLGSKKLHNDLLVAAIHCHMQRCRCSQLSVMCKPQSALWFFFIALLATLITFKW